MKYLIKEEQLDNLIYNQIDIYFDKDNINYIPFEEDGVELDSYIFYYGEFSNDQILFKYYNDEYVLKQNEKPIVELQYQYSNSLNNLFGDMWKEPFRRWFETNFGLNVKTVK